MKQNLLRNELIETNRLRIFVASEEQMVCFIANQSVEVLKTAYSEMLSGCLTHPDQWVWYAIWMIELKDGTHIGELCFKGISEEGIVEIGYGIADEYQRCGYATEAVYALVNWALRQVGVVCVKAEVEETNIASLKVLKKSGFIQTKEKGNEGLLFIRRK